MAEDAIIKYKMLAIGGSAGSLDVILKIVAALPFISHLATVIIVHRKNDGESILTDLLSSRTKLVVKEIEDQLFLIYTKDLPKQLTYEELMERPRLLKRNYFDF